MNLSIVLKVVTNIIDPKLHRKVYYLHIIFKEKSCKLLKRTPNTSGYRKDPVTLYILLIQGNNSMSNGIISIYISINNTSDVPKVA